VKAPASAGLQPIFSAISIFSVPAAFFPNETENYFSEKFPTIKKKNRPSF